MFHSVILIVLDVLDICGRYPVCVYILPLGGGLGEEGGVRTLSGTGTAWLDIDRCPIVVRRLIRNKLFTGDSTPFGSFVLPSVSHRFFSCYRASELFHRPILVADSTCLIVLYNHGVSPFSPAPPARPY